MQEINPSHVVMGLGAILVVFGIIQVFLQTISFNREKRRRLRSSFRLRNWRSVIPGMTMIGIGMLLLGFGRFVEIP